MLPPESGCRTVGIIPHASIRSRASSSMVEQWTFNPLVQGSSPWGRTIQRVYLFGWVHGLMGYASARATVTCCFASVAGCERSSRRIGCSPHPRWRPDFCLTPGSNARRASGLSQRELATRARTQQPVVARTESSARDVTCETLDRLLRPTGYRLTAIPTRSWRLRLRARFVLTSVPTTKTAHIAMSSNSTTISPANTVL